MAGVFELFHLSLIARRDTDLFYKRPSREEWLRAAFSEPFLFVHRNRDCHWVPTSTETGLVVGNVARSHKRVHHTPPDEGAVEVVSDEWQGALVLLDPSHHEDGQKLSFERDDTIGQPRAVLQSLLAHVNAMKDAPYAIEPKPIFNKANFWSWAVAHENELRRVAFDFVVPNMWGSSSDLDEELRELGAIGVQRARVILDGPEGIDAQSQQVRDGVEYASKGGGSITATAKNGDKFRSTDDAATAKLPPKAADEPSGIKVVTKWFTRLLGREQDVDVDGDDRSDGDAAGS